jgi:LytS/YehU family sensor histidine kinase
MTILFPQRSFTIWFIALILSTIALIFLESFEPIFTALLVIYFLVIILFVLKIIRFIQEYQQQERLTRLQLLQSQVMPHFLFNTLNLIYGNTDNNVQKSKETILCLSELLRVGLYETKKKTYSITEEIKFIENYISIYQLRYPNIKPISFKQNIDNNQMQIVPLILFPLVENAFKHGLERDISNTTIAIDIFLRERKLLMTVYNNFKPYPTENQQGIGIYNLKERLKIMYKGNFKMELKEEEKKFKSLLKLNLS